MDCNVSDSSGTDDDLPPSHQNRFSRGDHFSRNGRSASFARKLSDMGTQIHHIEQEAYCSVLRAFKAQSDAITWEKESLITELRKELSVSDEEHRELLSKVNADASIGRIREWRKAREPPLYERRPGAPFPALHSSLQPSPPIFKQEPPSGVRGNKSKAISPEDIRCEGEDHEVARRGIHPGTGHGIKKCKSRDGAVTTAKSQSEQDFQPSQNGNLKKASGGIEIMHTDTLVKQVENIFGSNHPDPMVIEKAMSMLKDHEQALVDLIAKLEEPSDNGSD